MRSALLSPPESAHTLDEWVEALRPASRASRLEVCPPQVARTRSWFALLRGWLVAGGLAPAVPRAAAPNARTDPLERIRQEFIDTVEDLATPAAEALLDRIHFARGLRELWHLRADVFSLVSLHHSQAEAAERLAWLNRHFPTRAPRSGFGALTTKDMWP
jgi:hypothetical protein